jgi:hypothetical protein
VNREDTQTVGTTEGIKEAEQGIAARRSVCRGLERIAAAFGMVLACRHARGAATSLGLQERGKWGELGGSGILVWKSAWAPFGHKCRGAGEEARKRLEEFRKEEE